MHEEINSRIFVMRSTLTRALYFAEIKRQLNNAPTTNNNNTKNGFRLLYCWKSD